MFYIIGNNCRILRESGGCNKDIAIINKIPPPLKIRLNLSEIFQSGII